MDMSLQSPPPLISFSLYLFLAIVSAGPIGLYVFRARLANASGARLAAKTVLIGLTVLTAPAAGLVILVVLSGAGETADLFWSLLRDAW
jgi:hypothetical protein